MYKVASDGRQRALHQGKPIDWVNGVEQLSNEDRLRQMQQGAQILDERIQKLPRGKERTELGLQKMAMQNELSAFRKLIGKERQERRGYEHVFIDCAKEILSPVQFKIIQAATVREWERLQENSERV